MHGGCAPPAASVTIALCAATAADETEDHPVADGENVRWPPRIRASRCQRREVKLKLICEVLNLSKLYFRFSKLCVQQLLAVITALTVFTYTAAPQSLQAADTHVIDLSELQHDWKSSQQARAANLADIERVLSLPAAQEALAKSHLTTARVTTAIAELDDAELAELAERARDAEQDVEGGIIVGLLALIGLVVVVLIVLSVVNDDDE